MSLRYPGSGGCGCCGRRHSSKLPSCCCRSLSLISRDGQTARVDGDKSCADRCSSQLDSNILPTATLLLAVSGTLTPGQKPHQPPVALQCRLPFDAYMSAAESERPPLGRLNICLRVAIFTGFYDKPIISWEEKKHKLIRNIIMKKQKGNYSKGNDRYALYD